MHKYVHGSPFDARICHRSLLLNPDSPRGQAQLWGDQLQLWNHSALLNLYSTDTLKPHLMHRMQPLNSNACRSCEAGSPPCSSAAFSSSWGYSHGHISPLFIIELPLYCCQCLHGPRLYLGSPASWVRNLLSLQILSWMCPLPQWQQSAQHTCLSLITSGQR